MIIVLKHGIKESEKREVYNFLASKGYRIREIAGEEETVLGAVGIVQIDMREVELLPGVERVIPITKPYKLASREFKKEDTVISVGNVKIGGLRISVIAGPCAVESREQILETAHIVRESGAVMLRGGAYKPRTSPYSFQGLGERGLQYMKEAGESEGMPTVSEIVSPEHAEMMQQYIDVFQIGARNMQNYELLKKVGSLCKPVILKRGLAATIEDWLMAAEYLLAHGADNVILCERGIRTFETYTRNTLDISAIPVVKKLSHLPIIVDPSHGTGIREKVPPMSLAAISAGADGLLLEVHPDPEGALSDGPQSLYPDQFEKLMRDIEALSPVLGKEIARLPEKESTPADYPYSLRDVEKTRSIEVAFQGESGAYSEMALHRHFQNGDARGLPCSRFEDVFLEVLKGTVDYGIIPIENSLAGSIHENYDLLLQYPDIKIVGEHQIRIVHNLIAKPDAEMKDIRKVYSHPQGLAQCAKFLDSHPEWKRIPFYDTAGSVAFIAKEGDKHCAAIASIEAARVYKMKVLKEGIETNPRNYTRFFILAREEHPAVKNPNKASLVFSVADKPGSLFLFLKLLAEKNLNMKKLESRPIPGTPWQYMFYVDVEIPENRDLFFQAVENMKKEAGTFRILGMYRV
ncbi:MAG: phospho-2-dehydro-3-deoxyheptonate aldolase [Spirochaetes bacterium]|nr:MAG: phospho-2-dehydro-3-deoxyheptonate aldolase [Spirochaetota bacterium]